MNYVEPSNTVVSARQTALKLENDKRKMEEELKEWLSILEKVKEIKFQYNLTISFKILLFVSE